MYISSNQEASTISMGFKNKNLDASFYKAKNPKDPHTLGHQFKNSNQNPSKRLSKPIPPKVKSKSKMVWVPKKKESKSNEASTSQKSSSIQKSHSYKVSNSFIPQET